MATNNSNKDINFNYIISSNYFKDIFTLEIFKDKMVNQLKPMIKKWCPNRFQHIDSGKFILYKVVNANVALSFFKVLKKKKKSNKNYGPRLFLLTKISLHYPFNYQEKINF